jgi:hypothetical protein
MDADQAIDWKEAAQRQGAYFAGERYQEQLRKLSAILGKPVEHIDAAIMTMRRQQYHGMASYDLLDLALCFHQILETQQPQVVATTEPQGE